MLKHRSQTNIIPDKFEGLNVAEPPLIRIQILHKLKILTQNLQHEKIHGFFGS
jgi:hypothetical protein